jgi:hypothetical protein
VPVVPFALALLPPFDVDPLPFETLPLVVPFATEPFCDEPSAFWPLP